MPTWRKMGVLQYQNHSVRWVFPFNLPTESILLANVPTIPSQLRQAPPLPPPTHTPCSVHLWRNVTCDDNICQQRTCYGIVLKYHVKTFQHLKFFKLFCDYTIRLSIKYIIHTTEQHIFDAEQFYNNLPELFVERCPIGKTYGGLVWVV